MTTDSRYASTFNDDDDDDEDNGCVTIGTELPPLEPSELIKRKPIALEDQVVRDKNGLIRFHGAFTGGFSAGYFNTVGSKEGWAPSSFISSRKNKNEMTKQLPEHFMDDEDFSAFGVAPKKIAPTAKYDNKVNTFSDEFLAPVFAILQSKHQTIGIQLLEKMGWKNKNKGASKVYGCALPSEECGLLDEITFPFESKKVGKLYGLGFAKLQGLQAINEPSGIYDQPLFGVATRKKQIRGEAFGVGAFETEDADIYAQDSLAKYDFELTSEHVSQKPQFAPTTTNTAFDKFAPAKHQSNSLFKRFFFAAPAIPANYKPMHKSSNVRSASQVPCWSTDSIFQRSLLLDSEATLKAALQQHRETTGSASSSAVSQVPSVKSTDLRRAEAATIEASQCDDRFKQFQLLVSSGKCNFDRAYDEVALSTMTEWERQKEKETFIRRVQLSKPLSGEMSNRFTPAVCADQDHRKSGANASLFVAPKSDKEHAAEMKMFGQMTREVCPWRPDRLLSKRMNIPYLETADADHTELVRQRQARRNAGLSVFDVLGQPEGPTNARRAAAPDYVAPSESSPSPVASGSVQHEELAPSVGLLSDAHTSLSQTSPAFAPPTTANAASVELASSISSHPSGVLADDLTTRPSLDLFKSIFGESDSDEEMEVKAASPTPSTEPVKDTYVKQVTEPEVQKPIKDAVAEFLSEIRQPLRSAPAEKPTAPVEPVEATSKRATPDVSVPPREPISAPVKPPEAHELPDQLALSADMFFGPPPPPPDAPHDVKRRKKLRSHHSDSSDSSDHRRHKNKRKKHKTSTHHKPKR